MRSKALALVAGVALGMAAIISVGAVQAAKPTVPEEVPLHRHYFETASGETVYVGPNICDIPMSEQGWAAFHLKVHVATAGQGLEMQSELCPIGDDGLD